MKTVVNLLNEENLGKKKIQWENKDGGTGGMDWVSKKRCHA